MTTEPDGMILIEGVLVDVRALLRLKHYCDPMLCRNGRYCCAQYEITVDKADIKRAVGLMPDAAKFAPEVGEGGEFEANAPIGGALCHAPGDVPHAGGNDGSFWDQGKLAPRVRRRGIGRLQISSEHAFHAGGDERTGLKHFARAAEVKAHFA